MSGSASVFGALKVLFPLIPKSEKKRFLGLLVLSVIMACTELAITGGVALLAAIFGSFEAVLRFLPAAWLEEGHTFHLFNDPRYLALGCLVLITLAIFLKRLLLVFQQWHLTSFSERIGNGIRNHLLHFYLRSPYIWVLQTGTSELFFGLSASQTLAGTLMIGLQVFSNLLMGLTIFLGLISISPVPSLIFVCVLGIGGTIIVKSLRRVLDSKAADVYRADFASHVIQQMAIHGLKEMRMYGRENLLFERYAQRLEDTTAARVRQQTIARLPVSSLEVMGFSTLLVVMCFLLFAQDAGMARISGIMGFMAAAAWRTLPVANSLVDSLTALRAGLPYLYKVVELVELEQKLQPEMLPDFDERTALVNFTKEIRLDDIRFSYPKARQSAVNGVSFSIRPGEMLGLVGLSGAGKSTLVNILTGLIPPCSGKLLVDGVEITKDNACAWLGHIGYVAQAPYILDASLAENIALSRWGEEIDRDRVLECCRMAALDFVDDLEKGIDSMLGERGVRLSGGQAQRVAIARSLYSNPALIIFDEATSALDMKNEKAIHETIMSLRSQVTMVIIAHRLTTVEGCDRIIWMEKGAVHRSGGTTEILPEYTAALKAEKALAEEASA